MKLDGQAILDAVKAQGLPVLEKDMIAVVDIVLKQVATQAAAAAVVDPKDFVAGGLAMFIPVLQPEIDALLAKLVP